MMLYLRHGAIITLVVSAVTVACAAILSLHLFFPKGLVHDFLLGLPLLCMFFCPATGVLAVRSIEQHTVDFDFTVCAVVSLLAVFLFRSATIYFALNLVGFPVSSQLLGSVTLGVSVTTVFGICILARMMLEWI